MLAIFMGAIEMTAIEKTDEALKEYLQSFTHGEWRAVLNCYHEFGNDGVVKHLKLKDADKRLELWSNDDLSTYLKDLDLFVQFAPPIGRTIKKCENK